MIGIEEKLLSIASKIDIKSMFEVHQDLVKMVNDSDSISDDEKSKLNAQFDDIKKQLKDLGND